MEFLKTLLSRNGIHLTETQLGQFNTYYQLLIEWNQKMNLTAIRDKREVILKHFYDSVTPSFYYPFNRTLSVCDVGSGAGFPGIPLKILYPQLELTIVDSLKKRLTFLETLVSALNLQNVRLIHDRAETFGQRHEIRESFDLVTARAVARMSILAEYCLPLVRVNGDFLALKGSHVAEEMEQADHAICQLGGKRKQTIQFSLPEDASSRSIVIIEKKKPTPKKYPRKPGTPVKDPL